MDGSRRKHLPAFVTTVIASLALAAPAAHAADCAGANLLPALASVPTAKAATLCLINDERAAHGLAPLSVDPVLETAATAYSKAMVSQRFFDHVSPGGQTIEQRLAAYVASATSYAVGENLAWGEGPLATPASIVRSWMASDGHRDNILSRSYDEIGVGIAGGSPRGSLPAIAATYTTEFGATSSSATGASPRLGVFAGAARRPADDRQARLGQEEGAAQQALPPRRQAHEGVQEDAQGALRPLHAQVPARRRPLIAAAVHRAHPFGRDLRTLTVWTSRSCLRRPPGNVYAVSLAAPSREIITP